MKSVIKVTPVTVDPLKTADNKFLTETESRPQRVRRVANVPSWMQHLNSDHMKLAEQWLQTDFTGIY